MKYYDQLKGADDANVFMDTTDPLEALNKKYHGCEICDGNEYKCFGQGVYNPLVMFIGWKPSKYDAGSRICSDKIGQKIHGLISYLGKNLPMDNNVYVTNAALCVGGYMDVCKDRLKEEIKIVNPKNIILLGDIWGLPRLTKNVVELDKYYPVFVTRTLKELFFKRDEVKLEVKEDLDFFIKQHD